MPTSICRSVIATYLLGISFLCPFARCQDEATLVDAENASTKTTSTPPKTRSSEGSWGEAIARTFQYDYQYLEQPSQVLIQGSNGKTQLVPNPEYNLNQHSFSIDFSQMFASGDFTSAWKANKPIAPWKAFLNGIMLKAQFAEHTRVVQQTILPSGSLADDYNIGGEADFDPSKVFKDFSQETHRPSKGDDWAEVIPKVSFKRVTPFDLVKYGGGLVPQSTQNGLNTIEMTWDARRLLRAKRVTSTSDKVAADQKICVVWFLTSKSYIGLPSDASSRSCQQIAQNLGDMPFQLGCSSEQSATWGTVVRKNQDLTPSALPNQNECRWEL